jgi:hypothetical protein
VIRAKRNRGKEPAASSEEEERYTSSDSLPANQHESTPEQRAEEESVQEQRAEEENKENAESNEHVKSMKRSAREGPEPEREQAEPFLIRPSATLLRRTRMQPISLDELTPEHRELYLSEFIPPNPMMETNEVQRPSIDAHAHVYQQEQDGEYWPTVGV